MAESKRDSKRDSKRYLGLELSGAKNQKTAIAALEYYPKERKIFLLDIFEKIVPHREGETADEALLELIHELTHTDAGGKRLSSSKSSEVMMGVNVPLQLPPCLDCGGRKSASGHCKSPAVKWMTETTRKMQKLRDKSIRVLEFTPYTQRPIELWVRYQVMPRLPDFSRFEIDETLGGNKAPLTARMNYLKRFLTGIDLVEVWPKLTMAILAPELQLSRRTIMGYRHLEEGAHARELILEELIERHGIFVYERDIRKLSQNLASFDAFLCAYTALLSDTHRCTKAPAGFPAESGWVHYPAAH